MNTLFTKTINDVTVVKSRKNRVVNRQDNMQMRLANIDRIETLDTVLEYDYTVGYPEKLRF